MTPFTRAPRPPADSAGDRTAQAGDVLELVELLRDYHRSTATAEAAADRLADTGISPEQLRAVLEAPESIRAVADPLHRTQLAAELAERAAHQRRVFSAIRTEALHEAVLQDPSGVAGVARRLGRQRQSVSREYNDRPLLEAARELLDLIASPPPPKKGRRP